MDRQTKFADLPDLDFSSDLYETPAPKDRNSNSLTAGDRESDSDGSHYEDAEQADDRSTATEDKPISTQRLQIDRARSRFEPARVDARDVDFSDRVSGARKSYRTSSRPRHALGDLSDDEDESLARKLARLRREVEEVKAECELHRARRERQVATRKKRGAVNPASDASDNDEDEDGDDGDEESGLDDDSLDVDGIDTGDKIALLIKALDAVELPRRIGGADGPEEQLKRQWRRYSKASTTAKRDDLTTQEKKQQGVTSGATPRPTKTDAERHALAAQALSKAADLDERLVALERVLGVSGSNAPGSASADDPARPILPTIAALHDRISALANADETLDAVGRRALQLAHDADRLAAATRSGTSAPAAAAAAAASSVLSPTSTTTTTTTSSSATATSAATAAYIADAGRAAKVDALYAGLATLDAVAPTLPPLLERLRGLHRLHASAAGAAALLDGVGRGQDELAAELARWRDALDRLEVQMAQAEGSMVGNMKVVGGWVRELEGRLQTFDGNASG